MTIYMTFSKLQHRMVSYRTELVDQFASMMRGEINKRYLNDYEFRKFYFQTKKLLMNQVCS